MRDEQKDIDKRNNTRLNLALEIALPDQSGKTINISASGVFFEVITNKVDDYAIGKILPVQISAVTTTPGFEERKIKLSGNGCVVRNDTKEVTRHGNRLWVALQFMDSLGIVPNVN